MTIFEKIVAGEIPSYKIAEDDRYLAFLDVFPLKEGHCLVIPRKPQIISLIYRMMNYKVLWSLPKRWPRLWIKPWIVNVLA